MKVACQTGKICPMKYPSGWAKIGFDLMAWVDYCGISENEIEMRPVF